MRRSALPPKNKKTKKKSQAHVEPNAKKRSNIATLDNGTMVEAFKFLDYCQLAKNSLVSMRFRDVIQTHRHQLALLYVDKIWMLSSGWSVPIKIFDKELSPEAYNEWVVCNSYSKRVPLEHHDVSPQSTQNISKRYIMARAYINKDLNHPMDKNLIDIFSACEKIIDETWPLFEHFVRLLTDPCIYIYTLELFPQNDVFNLLAATYDRSNRGRLHCQELEFYFEGYTQKSFNWIKDHIRCVEFQCAGCCISPNYDKQLLDLFATGSHCASEIGVGFSYISKGVVIDFVQKFMDLKSCDESHIVQSIRLLVTKPTAKVLKKHYATFFIEEEKNEHGWISKVFEIVNVDVGKKMQLSIKPHILTLHPIRCKLSRSTDDPISVVVFGISKLEILRR